MHCTLAAFLYRAMLMHSLNVVYFLYASSDCTMKPVHQNYSHIFSLYLFILFYTSSYCCIQKEYIKINHISCVYFLCIHQIYIRYNGVDMCTLFVYKLCTNHLQIFVRGITSLTACLTSLIFQQ